MLCRAPPAWPESEIPGGMSQYQSSGSRATDWKVGVHFGGGGGGGGGFIIPVSVNEQSSRTIS